MSLKIVERKKLGILAEIRSFYTISEPSNNLKVRKKKNKMYKILFFLKSILLIGPCFGQNYCFDSTGSIFECHPRDTLVDKVTLVKYILDRTENCITAIEPSGKKLWETNPWEKEVFRQVETGRRIFTFKKNNYVSAFYFWSTNFTNDKEVIWLNFDNLEAGAIEKLTGRFRFMGND